MGWEKVLKNRKTRKKITLILYFIALIAICIYVPLTVPYKGSSVFRGYFFIWTKIATRIGIVEIGRLFLEFIGITAFFGILFVLQSDRKI